ncbi:MAG: helix-turn-helix domain-containing protein [Lachnospiraceae bacterium]|nr:helix-turn-helix domain-containing protein [Lachnospiraceae bacterium]
MTNQTPADNTVADRQLSEQSNPSDFPVTSIDIGRRIQDLLDAHHMSKYRLSKLTGIDQTALANNISGKHIPTISNIERMCDALGITLAEFFSAES